MKSGNKTCRLCLKACDIFGTITEATRETLNQLQLEIDLAKTENPLICGKCSETIQKWLTFKSSLQTQANVDRDQNLDKVCSYTNEGIRIFGNNMVCCLCVKIATPTDCYVALKNEQKRVTLAKIILLKYFGEIDINLVKDPLICTTCLENLEGYSTFITTCSDSEEKIKKYCKDNGIDSIGHYELCRVIENKNFNLLNEIKAEEMYSTTTVSTYDDAYINMETNFGLEDKKINIIHKDAVKLELKAEKTDIEYENPSNQSPQEYTVLTQLPKELETYKCHICEYETKKKSHFYTHVLIHNDSEVSTHKCTECSFETLHDYCLRRHMAGHKRASKMPLHKCIECGFESNYKATLLKHMSCHKINSNLTVYKCALCSFETTHKPGLYKHLVMHNNSNIVAMHKCTKCSFKANLKIDLQQHMIVHKRISEANMHKCTECSFKTKHKNHLHQHMVVHSITETIVHRCTECSFETNRKNDLHKHTRVHSDSKVTMHKCTECGFQSKYALTLKAHVLNHRMMLNRRCTNVQSEDSKLNTAEACSNTCYATKGARK